MIKWFFLWMSFFIFTSCGQKYAASPIPSDHSADSMSSTEGDLVTVSNRHKSLTMKYEVTSLSINRPFKTIGTLTYNLFKVDKKRVRLYFEGSKGCAFGYEAISGNTFAIHAKASRRGKCKTTVVFRFTDPGFYKERLKLEIEASDFQSYPSGLYISEKKIPFGWARGGAAQLAPTEQELCVLVLNFFNAKHTKINSKRFFASQTLLCNINVSGAFTHLLQVGIANVRLKRRSADLSQGKSSCDALPAPNKALNFMKDIKKLAFSDDFGQAFVTLANETLVLNQTFGMQASLYPHLRDDFATSEWHESIGCQIDNENLKIYHGI